MYKYRVFLIGSAAALAIAAPSGAQTPDNVIINILRECAKIADPTARLTCYDNNMGASGTTARSVPGQGPTVNGGPTPAIASNGASGFGADSIKSPDRFESAEARGQGPDEIRAVVTAAQQREPGVYLVTIDGGAQWLFSDAVSRSFRPPRKGDTVEIQRASLGSFLMVVNNQQGVRVRRVR